MLRFFKSNLFFFLVLTIAVFSLYGKSINFDFTYHDDDGLILQKQDFLARISNIPKLFTTSCYYSKDFQYYRPILNLSFLIETCIFGLNTKIYHLTNIILFILALYLMYVFLVKLNLNQTILKFIILLLSVHPIFTSTVVWIPARNDTLLTIFILLSFIFFIEYLNNNLIKNLVLYLSFFIIALFTKETALLMLFLYPIFVKSFNYNLSKKEIYKHTFILIPILIIYFYLRSISVSSVSIGYYFDNISMCFSNFIVGISTYLYNLFIPIYISIMSYDTNLTIGNIILDIFLVLVILFSYYKKLIDVRVLFFSVVWFILGLSTTFLLQDYVYLNHRLILSLFGIVLILAYIINKLTIKYAELKKYFVFVFVMLFLFCFANAFTLQNKYVNKYEYWINAYLDAPKYHAAYYFIAYLYLEQKNYSKAKDFLVKANEYGSNRYLSDLALLYYYEGDMDKSEEIYNKAIEYGINKAQCYRNLSTIYLKRDKDINKSIEYAKLAVQENPYDTEYKQYLQNLIAFDNKLADEKNNI